MLFVVSAVLFDMLKARQLACVSKSGQKCPAALSLSSWRAWIEIKRIGVDKGLSTSLSSWRAWIEIETIVTHGLEVGSRSPHGERGLKCRVRNAEYPRCRSLSSWRAWIEIPRVSIVIIPYDVALLMESVD